MGASTCWHCRKQDHRQLAKAAAKLPQPHLFTTYKEVKTLLKQKQKSAWKLKNNGYDPQKDQINTLDRRTQTTIFRLRTGHCGLRKHLKRLGLADSAHCECGSEKQTPEHILQTCPHLETVHQQFWPEDTEVGTMPPPPPPPAHTGRQYANSFGQKTVKWAPGSGGRLTNYSGLPSSHQPGDLARSSHRTQKKLSQE